MINFDHTKKTILRKEDKSKKGSYDEKVISLGDTINKKKDYFTLSSCSGRILLMTVPESERRDIVDWFVVTHDVAKPTDFLKEIHTYTGKEKLLLKQESAILHVCCRTLDHAQQLIDIANKVGFKKAGILGTRKKIVVEVVCPESLSVPVFDGKKLVTDEYMEYVLKLSNEKLKKSWKALEKLEKAFQENS